MGCTNSKEDYHDPNKQIQGVGATERLVSRADRLKEKQKAGQAAANPPAPKLDESGRLMPEEVVKRSTSSIVSKILELGTPEEPITLEVRWILHELSLFVVWGICTLTQLYQWQAIGSNFSLTKYITLPSFLLLAGDKFLDDAVCSLDTAGLLSRRSS